MDRREKAAQLASVILTRNPPLEILIEVLNFALKEHAIEAKADQRQMCATDIAEYAEMRSESLHGAAEKLVDICLNATREK